MWTAKPPHDIGFKTSPGPVLISVTIRAIELCRPFGLAILFWIAIALWFAARRALLYLLPVVLCAALCVVVYGSWWHVGLLYPSIVCLLWHQPFSSEARPLPANQLATHVHFMPLSECKFCGLHTTVNSIAPFRASVTRPHRRHGYLEALSAASRRQHRSYVRL